MRITGDRDAACTASRSTRRSAPPGIRCRATARRRRSSLVHTDEGLTGVAWAATPCPTASCSSGCSSASIRCGRRSCASSCETVDFHGGRPWTVEVAVWDVVGKALGVPLWQLLGGRSRAPARVRVERRAARARRARRSAVVALRDAGIRAVKIRFHHADWRDDVAVVEAVRDAVGAELEIMVDANQGWRMPGDREPRWDVATAAQCARALEPLGVYWLEEPLRTDDVEGYRALRGAHRPSARGRRDGAVGARGARPGRPRRRRRAAGGRRLSPAGSAAAAASAALADLHGRAWSPHTWSNGYGLVANLHAALAFSTVPFVEVPFDPPAWSPERRDWLLPAPRRDRRRRDDRAAGRPGARRRARSRRARALEGRDEDPGGRAAASRASPSSSRRSSSIRRRRARCS